jgi:hypothetical protein
MTLGAVGRRAARSCGHALPWLALLVLGSAMLLSEAIPVVGPSPPLAASAAMLAGVVGLVLLYLEMVRFLFGLSKRPTWRSRPGRSAVGRRPGPTTPGPSPQPGGEQGGPWKHANARRQGARSDARANRHAACSLLEARNTKPNHS